MEVELLFNNIPIYFPKYDSVDLLQSSDYTRWTENTSAFPIPATNSHPKSKIAWKRFSLLEIGDQNVVLGKTASLTVPELEPFHWLPLIHSFTQHKRSK